MSQSLLDVIDGYETMLDFPYILSTLMIWNYLLNSLDFLLSGMIYAK